MAKKNTPKGKGIRTAYQALGGLALSFVTGLVAIPEVQEYIRLFIQDQGFPVLLGLLGLSGVYSGLIAFGQNKAGK